MNRSSHKGMGQRPLAITADDYGLDAAVNRGIESLAGAGRITGVSVMMHDGAVLDGLDQLNGRIPLGVHLTLVEERPLLAADPGLAPLLDGEGRLPGNYRVLFKRIAVRPTLLPALAREAAAQVERFLGMGLKLDFINSHQHVHLFPPLWLALHPLLKRHPVALRGCRRLSKPGASPQGLVNLAAWISWRLRPLPGRCLSSPMGISHAGRLTLETAIDALSPVWTRPRREIDDLPELVTHPGQVTPALDARYSHWNYRWRQELELLRSRAFKGWLEEAGFVLTPVNRFPEGTG